MHTAPWQERMFFFLPFETVWWLLWVTVDCDNCLLFGDVLKRNQKDCHVLRNCSYKLVDFLQGFSASEWSKKLDGLTGCQQFYADHWNQNKKNEKNSQEWTMFRFSRQIPKELDSVQLERKLKCIHFNLDFSIVQVWTKIHNWCENWFEIRSFTLFDMLDDSERFARRPSAHWHVILGARARRQAVHRGRVAQHLVLRHCKKRGEKPAFRTTQHPKTGLSHGEPLPCGLVEIWRKKLNDEYHAKFVPSAAAVQWANMNPELSPPSLTKKAGKSL